MKKVLVTGPQAVWVQLFVRVLWLKVYGMEYTTGENVDGVESRNVTPDNIADKVISAIEDKHPGYVYKINRNPLLLLLNSLPDTMQVDIIGLILK